MTAVDERVPETVLRSETVEDVAPIVTAPAHHDWQRLTGRVLIAIALLTAWTFTYLFALSGLDEQRTQNGLYARLRSDLAQGTAPIKEPIATGSPIALLDVPAAGIHRTVVVEGTKPAQLEGGPGHLRSTVPPGQAGISVLMGRAHAFGGPFSGIRKLRPGDLITVTTVQGRFRYRVIDTPRTAAKLRVPVTTQAMLTLVTSSASGWLSGLESSSTLYVDATLLGKAQPRSGTPPAVASSEQPMHGDFSFSSLAALVLCLQLFGAMFAALVWARTRWSPTLAYLLGIPLLLASLWLVSDFAARLLPNLM